MTAKARSGARELPWLLAFSILIPLTLLTVWYPALRTFGHFEINYNEGWNAYRAVMTQKGVQLYGGMSGTTLTNYPPVSFHIVGFLGRLTGDVVAAGRYLSVVSLVLIGVLTFATVRRLSGYWQAGLYGSMAFLIWLAVFQPDRIGMNDPQLFAMVFSLIGLYAYVRQPDSNRWMCLSAIAFAISLFTKHNLLAFPLAAGTHLLLTRQFRRFGIWAGTFAAVSGAMFLIAIMIDGPHLWTHVTAPRPYSIHQAANHIGRYVWTLQLPLAAAVVWSLWNCATASRNFLGIALIAAHGVAFAFSGGYGVDGNIFFDCLLVVVLITGIAAGDLADIVQNRRFGSYILTAILLTPFVGAVALLPERILQDYESSKAMPALEAQFTETVGFLATRNGPVLCNNLLLCFEAGKEEEADTYLIATQLRTGRLTKEEVWNLIGSRHFDAIEVEAANDALVSPLPLEDGFMEMVTEYYRPALRTARYAVLTRKEDPVR